jgi:hypothetical protein
VPLEASRDPWTLIGGNDHALREHGFCGISVVVDHSTLGDRGHFPASAEEISASDRADPISATESIFRTETRVVTTDPSADGVSAVLGLPLSWHHLDSLDDPRATEERG